MRHHITIQNEEDRFAASQILLKNRYRVTADYRLYPGKRTYDHYLECELSTDKPDDGKLYIECEEDSLALGAILVKNGYTIKSFFQVRQSIRKYYYLEYEVGPMLEKKAQGKA